PADLGDFTFHHDARRWTVTETLDATFTDAVIVVHDGAVVFERFAAGMTPIDRHLLMSVSKSLTSTLAGVLVDRGLIDPAGHVGDYVHRLHGTSWEGCTLQHLLDMRAGTRFNEEDYADPNSDGRLIEQVSGYTTRIRTDLPENTYQWIADLPNAGQHGGSFQYRSILPDVLAWAMC